MYSRVISLGSCQAMLPPGREEKHVYTSKVPYNKMYGRKIQTPKPSPAAGQRKLEPRVVSRPIKISQSRGVVVKKPKKKKSENIDDLRETCKYAQYDLNGVLHVVDNPHDRVAEASSDEEEPELVEENKE